MTLTEVHRFKIKSICGTNLEPSETTSLLNMKSDKKAVLTDAGLLNFWALTWLAAWYIFSGFTLFMNKYILTYIDGDPTLLGVMQMLATLVCGYCSVRWEGKHVTAGQGRPPGFVRHMTIVGGLRFCTVLAGLLALNYVAVSFTETVKSSAPAFTVVISRLVLGQITGIYVKLSLIPVMGGLALCSANELSFNMLGFLFALTTNISECAQNVYSKMLISGETFRYSPGEMQFYTSVASFAVTLPTMFMLVEWSTIMSTSSQLLVCYAVNGVFFHCQTISAYYLMDYISPVTHSVANTGKRAALIWTSVLLFGNEITLLSGLGTAVVIAGVLLYNLATEVDSSRNTVKTLVQVGAGKMFVDKV